MSAMSAIEWTEATWNPTTGCTKISAGCKNCYAHTLSNRLQAMGVPAYRDGFKVAEHAERLNEPLARKKPTMYFVNSMSDLYHQEISFAFVDRVLETIQQTPRHIYQILTKRPRQMAKYFQTRQVPDNVWLGVSVENKKHGVPRIDILRDINAKVRFLSVEPLLEDLGKLNLLGIHWVIVGGESGGKARPMLPEWVAPVKKQCREYNAKFFFKQWGTWGADGKRRSKKNNGRDFQGRTWNEMPIVFSPKTV